MRNAWLIALGLALMTAASAAAGDVRILCEPGVRVYLDDEFVGVATASEGGLHLADVAPGRHRLWVEKDGRLSQHFPIEVDDVPFEVRVGAFKAVPEPSPEPTPRPASQRAVRSTPEPKAAPAPPAAPRPATPPAPAEEAAAEVGSLTILSSPETCTVEIDGATYPKATSRLSLGGLAAGRHRVSFSAPGHAPISGTVEVEPGAEITVRGNLVGGQVEVVQEGKGALRVYSTPTSCTLRFMGRLIEKTSPVLNLSFIPAGEYPLAATWGGRERTTTVTIKKDQRTVVDIRFADRRQPFTVTYEPE